MAFALAIFAGSADLRAAHSPADPVSPVLNIAPKAKNPQQKKSDLGFTSFLRQSAAAFGRRLVAGFVEAARQRQHLARKAFTKPRGLAQFRGKARAAAEFRANGVRAACSVSAPGSGSGSGAVVAVLSAALPGFDAIFNGGFLNCSATALHNKNFYAVHKFFPHGYFDQDHSATGSVAHKVFFSRDELSGLARRGMPDQSSVRSGQALVGLPDRNERVFTAQSVAASAIGMPPAQQGGSQTGEWRVRQQAVRTKWQRMAIAGNVAPDIAVSGARLPQNTLIGPAFRLVNP